MDGGGLDSTEVAFLLVTQRTWVNSQHSRNFYRGKIIDAAEVNQLHWLEESGQWLEHVDRTHLVLASGKSVLRKKF